MCCSLFLEKAGILLMLHVFQNIHERLCKLGRGGQETKMSAREVNGREVQQLREYPVRLGGHLILGIPSAREDDSLRMRSKRCEIKLHPWILAQFMLHPISGI